MSGDMVRSNIGSQLSNSPQSWASSSWAFYCRWMYPPRRGNWGPHPTTQLSNVQWLLLQVNVFLPLGLTVIPIMFRLIVDWKTGPAFREYYELGDFGRLIGFWAACCQAIFSYLGIEIIGIVAEETERQREILPRATRRVAYRAILYHVGAVFVLGLNVSANDPILRIIETQNYSSPFALMLFRAGIPALGQIINAVTVIALLGVANTRLYVSVCYSFARG
jgi:amino acid permease